ncbi:hypothetical protein LINGRAHAP2_LOCUS32370, partial [Linum grandiflorum]
MALRVHQCHPNPLFRPVKIRTCAIPRATQFLYRRPRTRILCASTKKSAAENSNLATDFAKEVSRINTHVTQREDAMKKSRKMLFCELCKFLDLEEDKVEMRWDEMNQEEKKALVKGFVDEWGANFHPLSARSVEELIEEHIQEKKKSSLSSSELSSSAFFPGLRRLMGFASESPSRYVKVKR